MRDINEIILHCSATKEGQAFTAKGIDVWHKARGYAGIGYHYVILLDGMVEAGRPENEIGAHCLGHNAKSIGVCYIGGLDSEGNPKDTRTAAQIDTMRELVLELRAKYPKAKVHGHNEFSVKACPCFNVQTSL